MDIARDPRPEAAALLALIESHSTAALVLAHWGDALEARRSKNKARAARAALRNFLKEEKA